MRSHARGDYHLADLMPLAEPSEGVANLLELEDAIDLRPEGTAREIFEDEGLRIGVTVDFGIPRCADAAMKLPACTTRVNTMISLRSTADNPIGGTVLPRKAV
jgi:hypothetical protein